MSNKVAIQSQVHRRYVTPWWNTMRDDDFGSINDIGFYIEEMKDLNGLILFASEGCGIAFAFDKRSNEIFSIPMDCLERSYAKIIANDFNGFIHKLTSQKLEY